MTQVILEVAEDPFSSMARQLGRIVDDLRGSAYVHFSRTESWQPAINIYETDTHFLICADLAGMPREQIDVRAEPDRIILRGHRAAPQPADEQETLCVHAMEIDSGPFCREITLPSAFSVDGIHAKYCDGFLWVHVPKR